jgi:hypothetical protein
MINGVIECDGKKFDTCVNRPLTVLIPERPDGNGGWIPGKAVGLDHKFYFKTKELAEDFKEKCFEGSYLKNAYLHLEGCKLECWELVKTILIETDYESPTPYVMVRPVSFAYHTKPESSE